VSTSRFLISPHEVLKMKNFVVFSCALIVIEDILLIYTISLSAVRGRCFKEEDLLLQCPYFFLAVLVCFQWIYYVLHVISAIFHRFKGQTMANQNRTKLALCTRGLSEAQKRRVHKTNFVMDIVMIAWIIFVFLNFATYMSRQGALCNYSEQADSSQSTSCTRCEFVPILFLIYAVAGILINYLSKVSLVSSEIDFSLQSQRIEAFLAHTNKSLGSSLLYRWYINAEARHAAAAPFICMATIGIVAVFVCWWLDDHLLPAGFTWNISVLVQSSRAVLAVCFLLSCSDGSVLRMILRIRNALAQDRSTPRRRNTLRRIFSWPGLTSLPRRKFVFALLSWSAMPLFAGFLLASNGARGGLYYYAISALVFNTFVFVIPMFLVHDRVMSIDDLLNLSSGDDNYGLVLSRRHLVNELRNALGVFNTVCRRGTEPIKIDVPGFLASQARVELSVAISYRWTDESLYKKKDNNSEESMVVYLSNHKCSGFDWNVKLTAAQAEMLLDGLSDAPEDYVWMDQFCIPQAKRQDVHMLNLAHELNKSKIRGMLVSRMTGLYACAGRVLVINNSGDEKLVEIDWYQNRLWCVQEYGFAWNLTVSSLSKEYTMRILERRGLFQRRWFDSTHVGGYSKGKVESANQSSDIILDWMHISDLANLKAMIAARVSNIDCVQYMEFVSQLSATDSNDTFSALAQPCFGIVMTSEESRKILAQAITAKMLSEPGAEDFIVINNINADNQFVPCSGSMRTERMLSGYLGGLESGEIPVHVS
jgi:hypothetical protein